jgi:hypothetical protein
MGVRQAKWKMNYLGRTNDARTAAWEQAFRHPNCQLLASRLSIATFKHAEGRSPQEMDFYPMDERFGNNYQRSQFRLYKSSSRAMIPRRTGAAPLVTVLMHWGSLLCNEPILRAARR